MQDGRGRKVGGKKDDLDEILSALSINAANPIAVMTQVHSISVSCHGVYVISLPLGERKKITALEKHWT